MSFLSSQHLFLSTGASDSASHSPTPSEPHTCVTETLSSYKPLLIARLASFKSYYFFAPSCVPLTTVPTNLNTTHIFAMAASKPSVRIISALAGPRLLGPRLTVRQLSMTGSTSSSSLQLVLSAFTASKPSQFPKPPRPATKSDASTHRGV